jgi:hypothetical protein
LTPIFSGFIRDDPPHLRHPRSITPYIDVKTALAEPSGQPRYDQISSADSTGLVMCAW